MLHEIVYISRAIKLFDQDELENLLTQARAFNQSQDITGLLLYKDQSFLQLLEGNRDNIHSLYKHIAEDDRHFRVKQLIDQPLDKREFGSWSMGFQNLNNQNIDNLPGFSNYLNAEYEPEEVKKHSREALQLLLHFRSLS